MLGSARAPRAGWKAWPSLRVRYSGVAPKRTFLFSRKRKDEEASTKVRAREDALASTRAACASRNLRREVVEVLHPFGLTEPDVTRF